MRRAEIERKTKETELKITMDLDEKAPSQCESGIGFFDHMMDVFAFQFGHPIRIRARGDLEVDDHHTVEDCGIALGQALYEALGDKKGIHRYGNARVPMDESLGIVDLDISGRPYLVFDADFKDSHVGGFSTQMVEEFLRALAMNARITLHVQVPYGKNDHHKVEAIFKALGRALKEAVAVEGDAVPSTKGVLE